MIWFTIHGEGCIRIFRLLSRCYLRIVADGVGSRLRAFARQFFRVKSLSLRWLYAGCVREGSLFTVEAKDRS